MLEIRRLHGSPTKFTTSGVAVGEFSKLIQQFLNAQSGQCETSHGHNWNVNKLTYCNTVDSTGEAQTELQMDYLQRHKWEFLG